MVDEKLIEEMAAKVLGIDRHASDDEIDDAWNEKVKGSHPDASDSDGSAEEFQAATTARKILKEDIDLSDPNTLRNIRDDLTKVVDEGDVRRDSGIDEGGVGYSSSAERRTSPGEYTRQDFARASAEEKREMMKEVALGIETTIIFNGVKNLYERGYLEEDFFEDINEYIGEASTERIDFEDYYEATKHNIRDGVAKEFFLDTMENVQDNLQREYGQGTNIREVSRIVAHFIIKGGVDIGDVGNFVGRGDIGDDPRFTRDHPLGGHGSMSRGDSRFTRDDDRFE